MSDVSADQQAMWEALGLPWALVDFEAGTIRIARTLETSGKFGTPKSEAGNRTILMLPEFRAHLTVAGAIETHNGTPVTAENLRWVDTHESMARSWTSDVLTGLADLLDGETTEAGE